MNAEAFVPANFTSQNNVLQDDRPTVNEVSVNPVSVVEGETATFTFTSDIPMASDTVIDYVVTGSATADDDYEDDPWTAHLFSPPVLNHLIYK